MNKSVLLLAVVFFMAAAFLPAQGSSRSAAPVIDNPALKPIINNFAAGSYASGGLTKAELDSIIQAGVRAPSARNQQPWHFTVVQDQALAKRIISQVTDGNILIVVSAAGDGKTNGAVILDCGLAVQSMYLAAQALGLGSRIYTGPVDSINKNFKNDLALPKDHNAVAVIRIGRLPPNVDAVSSASSRNSADRIVSYK
ncbi:MAG: nitroreductase family protein [Treponema sp.]|jgi:nitroreductase|nr:nitroreductase family protein [Treponema sp.]